MPNTLLFFYSVLTRSLNGIIIIVHNKTCIIMFVSTMKIELKTIDCSI